MVPTTARLILGTLGAMTPRLLARPTGRHRRPDVLRTPLLAGTVAVGRYELVAPLGRGSAGSVWLSRDRRLERDVAVKVVDGHRPATGAQLDVRRRCLDEARAAARVRSDGVITVHDVVEHDGRPWLVMDLVPGRTLAEVIAADGALPARTVAALGVHLATALRAVHAAAVVHRDVKPANIVLAHGGRPVLLDFGIAVVQGSVSADRPGTVVGSPAYLAPEVVMGAPPAPAADLWSLGATLYALVEGRPPFPVTDPAPTLAAVVRDDPVPPRAAGPLLPALEGLLVKDPARRVTAEEAAAVLLRVVRG